MKYIDGFVTPVPAANKAAYRKLAAKAAKAFTKHGALRVVECWGDDVPAGKLTDFRMAVKAKDGETIVFSWVEWPSKRARDAGMKKVMAEPGLQPGPDMPFDGKRLIYGGFVTLLDATA